MGSNRRVELVARRACPRCHTFIDWQACDHAFTARAEYRICPECDEAIFVQWRGEDRSKCAGPDAAEAS